MTLRTGEDTLIWRRRLWIALCGGTVLEEALDLSSDRILNEWISEMFRLLYKHIFKLQFKRRFLNKIVNVLKIRDLVLLSIWDIKMSEYNHKIHKLIKHYKIEFDYDRRLPSVLNHKILKRSVFEKSVRYFCRSGCCKETSSHWYIRTYIQSVPGGMDKTSGECSLC